MKQAWRRAFVNLIQGEEKSVSRPFCKKSQAKIIASRRMHGMESQGASVFLSPAGGIRPPSPQKFRSMARRVCQGRAKRAPQGESLTGTSTMLPRGCDGGRMSPPGTALGKDLVIYPLIAFRGSLARFCRLAGIFKLAQ